MELGVLGPLNVTRDGRDVPVSASKQRALLALLVLRRNEVVPTDVLVDQLWSGEPPSTAVKALQTYVSQLRRTLGEGILETRAGGYVLRAPPASVDADRFEALLDEARGAVLAGRPGAARHALDEALALWRGPPFLEIRYDDAATREIARLDELRVNALELRAEADLALGRAAEVVPALESLVREHPLRERLWALLMLALYRCGRQADALAAYSRARTILVDELGLEPGDELRRLERAILEHDPSLEPAPPPAPAAAPAPRRGSPRRRALTIAGVLTGAAVATVAAIVVVRSETSGAATTVITGNSVGVLQRSTGRPTGDVELTSSPGAVAYGAGALWVTYADSDAVARVDATRLVSTATAQVGDGPAGVAVGAGAVWVANGLDGTVSRVDPETNRQVQVIRVGNGPTGIAYGGGTVWVANSADGTVTAIDPTGSRAPRTIPAVLGAAHVAFGFGRVWVVSPTQGSVVALDPTTGAVLDRVNVGTDPDAIATGAGAVWVANGADDTVWRIDPREPVHVAGAVPVGGTPVAIAAGSGAVWVGVRTATLQRISAARLRVDKTIDVGHVPAGIAVAGDDVLTAVRSTGAAHRGGTLRVVMPAPDTLDPARAYFPSSSTILSLTNDGLIGYRRVGGAEGVELVPDLAAAIPVPTDDGRTYTFRLRPGLRYSDGSLVRASDVRRSVERVFEASPTSAGIGYYGDIVGATGCRPKHRCDLSRGIAVDDAARTVTFHLKAPDGSFLNALALPFADVVPARVHAGRRLPATGPYMLARYVRGRSATLVRNPRFREWSADAQPDGYPNVITFRFRPFGSDSMPEARDVEAGRADVAPNLIQPPLTKPQLTALLVRHPSTVHLDAISSTRFFFLNTRVAPFDDVRVRRAVNDAFDREAFVRLLGPGNTPTCQILPPNFPSYRRTCPYRDGGAAAVAHARQVVRASGHEGARVTVWTFHVFAAQGRFMTSVLNAIGLRARLDVLPQDPNAYFEHVDDSRTRAQAGWFGWVTDFPSEGGFLSPLLRCAAFVPDDPTDTLDPAELCDRHLDRVLARASAVQASNPAAASPLWRAAERIALRAAPFVPTSNTENVALLRRGVGNYEYNPQLGVLLDELWVR